MVTLCSLWLVENHTLAPTLNTLVKYSIIIINHFLKLSIVAHSGKVGFQTMSRLSNFIKNNVFVG
jgi:hypothetical protein